MAIVDITAVVADRQDRIIDIAGAAVDVLPVCRAAVDVLVNGLEGSHDILSFPARCACQMLRIRCASRRRARLYSISPAILSRATAATAAKIKTIIRAPP